MANQYLFEIHRYISEKLKAIQLRREDAIERGDSSEAAFCEGQIEEFTSLKEHLAVQYNLSTQAYP